jgi:hypothetical protein
MTGNTVAAQALRLQADMTTDGRRPHDYLSWYMLYKR